MDHILGPICLCQSITVPPNSPRAAEHRCQLSLNRTHLNGGSSEDILVEISICLLCSCFFLHLGQNILNAEGLKLIHDILTHTSPFTYDSSIFYGIFSKQFIGESDLHPQETSFEYLISSTPSTFLLYLCM